MTVLDVHPVGFDTAARVFGEDVAGGVSAAVEVLLAALGPCSGMAGTDDTAQHWVPRYDSGARAAVSCFDDLVAGGYRLAALLEQCAINYAGAEAACLPGQTAAQSAARWAGVRAARHGPPPAAAGFTLPEPEGWSLLAHLIGRLWPNGHQDLLHIAGAAWHAAAATLTDLRPTLDHAVAAVADQQHGPETGDAVAVLTQYAGTLTSLADHCALLGDACTALAAALDHAHSTIAHDCLDFVNTTIAAEAAGGLLAAVTAGLAEAAAQAVVLRAATMTAAAVRTAIDAFASVITGIAADLDALAAELAGLSADLGPTLARTTVQAVVVRPGVAGVERVSRSASDLALDRFGLTVAKQTPPAPLVRQFATRTEARAAAEGPARAEIRKFFRGATGKARDFKITELPNGNYQLEFFAPADNPGYGKLFVAIVNRAGLRVKEYKDGVGPTGLYQRKWVHGRYE